MQIGYIQADWRDHPEVDAGMLAVLAVLATYADRYGVCWPSQARIGEKCRRSRTWAIRQINRLVEIGLLERTNRQRHDGGERTCLYRLTGHAGLFEKLTPPVSDDSTTTDQKITDHSLSVGEGPAVEENLIEVPDGWYPEDADFDRLFRERSDLRDRIDRIGRSTRRFVRWYRDRTIRVADVGLAWLDWMRQEIIGPPNPRAKPMSGLAERNQARADAALERIMARRGGAG